MAADGHRRRLLLMERLAATRSHALRLALALLVWSGAFVASVPPAPPALEPADVECSIELVRARTSGQLQPSPANSTLSVTCRGVPGGVQLLLSPWLQAAANASGSLAGANATNATRGNEQLPDTQITGVRVAGAPEEGGSSGDQQGSDGDWRLGLVCGPGVRHLRVSHSVLRGAPLSTRGPLLQLAGCGAVSFHNVTLTQLAAPPWTSPGLTPAYGAVHARGLVAGAWLSGVECSHVAGSHTWACFLLSFNEEEGEQGAAGEAGEQQRGEEGALAQGTVDIRDSVFVNTTVAASLEVQLNSTLLLPSVATVLNRNQYMGADCGGGVHGAVVVGCAPYSTSKANAAAGDGTGARDGGSDSALWWDLPYPPPVAVDMRVESIRADGCSGGCGAVISTNVPVASLLLSGGTLLSNCSAAWDGGAVYSRWGVGQLRVEGASRMDRNSAGRFGGALAVHDSVGRVVVDGGSSLSHNSAVRQDGGAIFVLSNITEMLVSGGSELSHNSAKWWGGVIKLGHEDSNGTTVPGHGYAGRVVVESGSKVLLNNAQGLGGVMHANLGIGTIILNGSSVEENTAGVETSAASSTYGGAFCTFGSVDELLLDDGASLSNNTANARGGAVHADTGLGRLVLDRGSSMSYNSVDGADSSGGAVSSLGVLTNTTSIEVLRGSRVVGNTASIRGGAIVVASGLGSLVVDGGSVVNNNSACDGGALYVVAGIESISVSNGSTVAGNTAYVSSTCSRGRGGVVATDGSVGSVLISGGSNVTRNEASVSGGAVHCSAEVGSFVLTGGSALSFNAAGRYGGAVNVIGDVGSLSITDGCSVEQNAADWEGGAFMIGEVGGAEVTVERVVVVGSDLRGNSASVGGALCVRGVAYNVLLSGSTVSYNLAPYVQANDPSGYGGALNFDGRVRNFTAQNATRIVYNEAAREGGALRFGSGVGSFTLAGNSSISHNQAQAYTVSNGGAVAMIGDVGQLAVLSGSQVYNNSVAWLGGAFYLSAADPVKSTATVREVRLDGGARAWRNAAGAGGWVYVAGNLNSLSIAGSSEVALNEASQSALSRTGLGGALSVEGSLGQCVIDTGSRVHSNQADVGGGAIAVTKDVRLFQLSGGSSLSNNKARKVANGVGGAVFFAGNTTNITVTGGAVVSNNTATSWGGTFRADDSVGSVLIHSSRVSINSGYGGGLLSIGGTCGNVAVVDSSLTGNDAKGADGGVFYVDGDLGAFTLQRSEASSNRAGYGGVLFVYRNAGELVLDGATVTSNSANNGYGGALSVYGSTRRLSILRNSSISLNAAYSGGAIASMFGFGSIHIADSVLVWNQATGGNGGAISGGHFWSWRDADAMSLLVEGSRIANNSAFRGGGAISLIGELSSAVFRSSTLIGNAAEDGGGFLDVRGMAGEVVLEAGTVGQDNRAGAMGGFLSVSAPDDLTGVLLRSLVLRGGSRLEGNVAGRLGGAVAAPLVGQVVVTEESSMSNNSATDGAGGAVAERAAVDWTPSVSLACRLLPSTAEWRIDGGSWVTGNVAGGGTVGGGGALLLATMGRCDEQGRPLRPSALRLTLGNATFEGNRAGAGGGGAIAVRGPMGPGAAGLPVRDVEVVAEGTALLGNTAEGAASSLPGGGGGAALMWVPSPAKLSSPVPAADGAVALAALEGNGGGTDTWQPQCRVLLGTGTVVQGNTAAGSGGAVALVGCGLGAVGAQLEGNRAGGAGGAVALLPGVPLGAAPRGFAAPGDLLFRANPTGRQDNTLTGPIRTCPTAAGYTAVHDADLPGSDLLPYPLYGTVPELAAACSANPLCVAFTSSGLRGALKGRGALLNTTTLVDTASPGAQWTCTYIKYTGVDGTTCPPIAGFVALPGMDSVYRNTSGSSSSSGSGAGDELADPVQLARECIPDSKCYGFDNRGWRGPVVLPAVPSDRPGSCLYIYQEGSCPHVEGFAAFWNIDADQNDIANANPDGEAAAGDVSIIAANCSADSRCLGFSSIGYTKFFLAVLTYNTIDIDPVVYCSYLRLSPPADKPSSPDETRVAALSPLPQRRALLSSAPSRWLDVSNTVFTDNIARNGSGGALHVLVAAAPPTSTGSGSGTSGAAAASTSSEQAPLLLQLSLSNSSFHRNVANGTGPADGGGACSFVLPAAARDSASNSTGNALLPDTETHAALDITSCNFTSNSAHGSGGALLLALGVPAGGGEGGGAGGCAGPGPGGQATPAAVRMATTRAAGNAAGRHGGALAFVQPRLDTCAGGGAAAAAEASGVTLSECHVEGNEAAGSGGGLYLSGNLAVGLTGAQLRGNAADGGPGGGIAASGCSQLAFVNSSATSNDAPTGTGGGVFAGGCGRVRLQGAELVGNRALAGGALHVAAGGGQQQVQQEGGLGAAGAPVPYNRTAVLVHQARFSNNSALDSGQVDGEEGRGGAVYLSGAVAAAILGGDFADGNVARFGSAIATTQTCRPGAGTGAGGSTAIAPSRRALQALDPRASSLSALEGAMASWQCYPLAFLGGTRFGALTAEQQAEEESDGQARFQLWSFDGFSSIYANCTSVTAGDGGVDAAVSYLLAYQQQASALEQEALRDDLTATLTAAQRFLSLREALSQCVVPSSINSSAALDRMLSLQPASIRLRSSRQPGTTGILAGATATTAGGLLGEGGVDGEAADGFAYQVNGLGEAGGGGPAEHKLPSRLRLRPGAPFDVTVQLHDVNGLPVSADLVQLYITMALMPPGLAATTLNATSSNSSSAAPSAPFSSWQHDPLVVRLDPGLIAGRSLTQRAVGGVAAWQQVVARGWPGEYRLVFTAQGRGPLAQLYQVAPYTLTVELLPCSVGEALEPSSGAQGTLASWTSCQPCGQEQLGLWRDMRPRLVPGGEFGQGNSTSILQADMGAIVSGLVDRGSNDRATCRPCPAAAQCPGGAVMVPRPGHWHSAANSTRVHRCPYAPACGGRGADAEELATWQERLQQLQQQQANTQLAAVGALAGTARSSAQSAGDPPLGDVRSAVLAQCQGAWYASGWRPGAAVVAAARQRGALPPGSNSIARAASPNGTVPPCLLWYEEDLTPSLGSETFAPLSYTQLQCAPSYTGNLCAACQPGYQAGVRFQCSSCPAVAQTAGIALLAFIGGVLVVLISTYANLYVDYTSEEVVSDFDTAELLKVLILHVQHVVIVTRINIDYPTSITACTAVLSAITWAGDWWGFSPSCLVPDQDSSGQAWAQLLGGLLVPCFVALCCLVLWAIRYRFRRFRRSGQQPLLLTATTASSSLPTQPNSDRLVTASSIRVPADAQADAEEEADSEAPATAEADAAIAPTASGRVVIELSSTIVTRSTSNRRHREVALVATGAGSGSGSNPPAECQQQPSHQDGTSCAHGTRPVLQTVSVGQAVADEAAEAGAATGVKAAARQSDQGKTSPGSDEPLEPEPFSHLATQPSCNSLSPPISQELHPKPLQSKSATADLKTLHHRGKLGRTTSWLPAPMLTAASRLHSATSSALIVTTKTISRLVPAPKPTSALAHVDRSLPLVPQLGIVLWVAVFVLYPSWVQVTLGIFACYTIDDGQGPYAEHQQATWRYGYWVRDMAQRCYAGRHLAVYVPLGVCCVLLFCLLPPLASFLVLWGVRRRGGVAQGQPDPLQHDDHVRQVYGFLYSRYKPRFWWWESAVQLQTLALVAAEVFGRALPVMHQALLLLAVLLAVSFITTACAPVRSRLLVMLEFASFCVLSLTITLGLYFAGEDTVGHVAAEALGALILLLNAAVLLAFLLLLGRKAWPATRRMVGRVRGQRAVRGRGERGAGVAASDAVA